MSDDSIVLKRWEAKIDRNQQKAEALERGVRKQLAGMFEERRKGLAMEMLEARKEGPKGLERIREYTGGGDGSFGGTLGEGLAGEIDENGYDDDADFSDLVGRMTGDY